MINYTLLVNSPSWNWGMENGPPEDVTFPIRNLGQHFSSYNLPCWSTQNIFSWEIKFVQVSQWKQNPPVTFHKILVG